MHTNRMWPLAEVDDSMFGRHKVFEPCLTLSIPTKWTKRCQTLCVQWRPNWNCDLTLQKLTPLLTCEWTIGVRSFTHKSTMGPDSTLWKQGLICQTLCVQWGQNVTLIQRCENWPNRWLVSEQLGYDRSLTSQRWAQLLPYKIDSTKIDQIVDSWVNDWGTIVHSHVNNGLNFYPMETRCNLSAEIEHIVDLWVNNWGTIVHSRVNDRRNFYPCVTSKSTMNSTFTLQ